MRAGNTCIKYVPCFQDIYKLVKKPEKKKKNRLIKADGESVTEKVSKSSCGNRV